MDGFSRNVNSTNTSTNAESPNTSGATSSPLESAVVRLQSVFRGGRDRIKVINALVLELSAGTVTPSSRPTTTEGEDNERAPGGGGDQSHEGPGGDCQMMDTSYHLAGGNFGDRVGATTPPTTTALSPSAAVLDRHRSELMASHQESGKTH